MAVLVGTSGWQYDDWWGRFYPPNLPKRAWLGYFASRFPTVEVNNSFYRLPTAETFARWREQTPAGFVVAVKASRFITHIRRMRDCRDPVELLWNRAKKLGPRLGPVLFQLPPRFPADRERLQRFLRVLPSGMRAAFEFRDPSWWTEDSLRALDDAGAAFVLPDRPGRGFLMSSREGGHTCGCTRGGSGSPATRGRSSGGGLGGSRPCRRRTCSSTSTTTPGARRSGTPSR